MGTIQQSVNQLLGQIESGVEQSVQPVQTENLTINAQKGQIAELKKQNRIQKGQLTRMQKRMQNANERVKERQEVLQEHAKKLEQISIGGQTIDPTSPLYQILKGASDGNS